MAKREKRDKLVVSKEEILKPLDLEKFGTDDDPCFGKLYNLSTSECKRCGDSEICGAVFAQKLNKDRGDIEKSNRFKDIELVKNPIKDYIEKLRDKNYNRIKIIRLTKKKFNITKDEVLKHL